MLFDLMMNGEEEESERFNTESLVKIKNVIGYDVKFEQTQTAEFAVDMPSDEMIFIETNTVHPSSFALGPVPVKKLFKVLSSSILAHFGFEPQFFVKKFYYKERNNFPLDLAFSVKFQTKYTSSSIGFMLTLKNLKVIADHIPEEYDKYKVDGKLPIYQMVKILIDPTVFLNNPKIQDVVDECIMLCRERFETVPYFKRKYLKLCTKKPHWIMDLGLSRTICAREKVSLWAFGWRPAGVMKLTGSRARHIFWNICYFWEMQNIQMVINILNM
jgi:hypothetical protein